MVLFTVLWILKAFLFFYFYINHQDFEKFAFFFFFWGGMPPKFHHQSMTTRGSCVHKHMVTFSGASWIFSPPIFSKYWWFQAKRFTRLLEFIKLNKQNPWEKFFIFTFYQNYTLALSHSSDLNLSYGTENVFVIIDRHHITQNSAALAWPWFQLHA